MDSPCVKQRGIAGQMVGLPNQRSFVSLHTLSAKVAFGLSTAHAAATVAVILIGFQIGLVNLDVLNGTIILVLITCVVSSFVVERNARVIAQQIKPSSNSEQDMDENIMVALSNPATASPLLELALSCQNPDLPGNLYAISIVTDNDPDSSSTRRARQILQDADRMAEAKGRNLEKILRHDLNIASGIVYAAREKESHEIILGWNPDPQFLERFWGGVLPSILKHSNQQVLILRGSVSLKEFKGLSVWVPTHLPLEPGFLLALKSIQHMHRSMGAPWIGTSMNKKKRCCIVCKPRVWLKFPAISSASHRRP